MHKPLNTQVKLASGLGPEQVSRLRKRDLGRLKLNFKKVQIFDLFQYWCQPYWKTEQAFTKNRVQEKFLMDNH